MINVADFLAEYREKRAKDIADTLIDPHKGWGVSHHNRIVFRCPKCHLKTGAEIDSSEGPQAEMWHACERCGSEIKLALKWCIEPELTEAKIKVSDPS